MKGRIIPWLKLLAGSIIIAAFAFLLATLEPPAGAVGEVVRHNLKAGISPAPLFYTEVDNIWELERGLRERARGVSTIEGDSTLAGSDQ